jgi:hypothetical protein
MAITPTAPSSSVPQPLSYEQILGNALSSYASTTGVNDLNVGSATTSLFQVTSLMVARASGDIFQILKDYSLDRATGPALQNLAIQDGVPPLGALVATSYVNVTDLSFQKIQTKIYAGVNPPIIGSTTIYVSDASSFPATGAIYLGRGTPNVEGPLPYSAKAQIGSYWSFTLSVPTTKPHNISESVILSQGGVRTVPANTIVVSPGIGTTPNVQFSVTQTSTILDGETTVTNVPVTALIPGSLANVPAGSISQFSGNPSGLPNASVTNPLAVTTGQDTETDNELRIRVKNKLASTGLGTVTAIESALQGVQSPDSADTIVSTDILNSSENTIVYVDNGSGYEATHEGVGIEAIVNSALGGEKFFQLVTGGVQTSVTKAFIQTIASSPFDLSGGEVLSVVVGDTTYNHTFQASDFANPGSATAYEVCASINGDTTLDYEAVTAGGGTYVVIRPSDEVNNLIQVTNPASVQVVDANTALQFPSQLAETLRLKKNGISLTQDGSTASIFTQEQSLWSPSLASGVSLAIAVDGTSTITYTFVDADFIAEGTYTSVSSSNSLQSWVNVFNAKLTGVTAEIVGSTIKLTSNRGPVNSAKIIVSPSSAPSLITEGVLSPTDLSSTGVASDYILNRNSAQIQLATGLSKGDSLSAGSLITEANVKTSSVSSGSVTLASDGHVWISIDTGATIIPTISGGSLLSVSKVGPNIIRYTSNTGSAFSNVLTGDYVIIWSAELPSSDQLEGRVHAFTGSTLDIAVTSGEYAAATPVTNATFVQGFVVVRTENVPQKFTITMGTSTLDVIASELQSQTDELTFTVIDNTNIQIITNTDDNTGQITIVTADSEGELVGFSGGVNSVSQSALIAFYDTLVSQSELPLFFHSTISADTYANPIASYITNFSSSQSLSSFDPNELLSFLNPYGGIDDEQPYQEAVQMSAVSGSSVTILPEYPDVRRLRISDRFFVANPLDFGYNDSVVTIVDNNPVGETYTLPLYRRAITNTSYAVNNFSFNAYDVDAGATASFSANFSGFSFANYKALMQAKYVVSATPSNTSLLYRATPWGRTGEMIDIAYTYPTSANKPINSLVTLNDSINIRISLASGASIGTSIAANTQWNVTITTNTPVAGTDQVTYTYNGTGTAPNLTLSGGEYVTISSSTGFNSKNIGTFKVSTVGGFTPTSTSFSVQVPTGTAFAQSNVVTTAANGISFYAVSATTASAINTYVNANLSQYVTTTIVNGDGSGTIVLSTFQDTGFVTSSYYLKDGINWVSSSNTSGSPQFTFKKALTYASAAGYDFNNGDEVRIIPTTMDQVKDLWNILAVTGFTTVGTVETSDRGTKLQLATTTIGSEGSVQIVGGSGNEYTVPVLVGGELIDPTHMIVGVSTIASQPMTSDQWFRLEAQNYQNKNTGFAANTSVTVASNTPIAGRSTITLLNQDSDQLYFGSSKSFVTVASATFRIEKQGSLVCLSWTGVGTTPVFSTPANFNQSAGWTASVTPDGIYTVLSGTTTFSPLSIGDLVNITGFTNPGNNGSFFVEAVGSSSIQVANANAVAESGTVLTTSSFTATLSVSEGDSVIITSPFADLNAGTFRVIRTNGTSIWYENPEMIEEEVPVTSNSQIKFYQYNATVPGDSIVVNGSVLGLGNAGTYPVVSVTSPTVAVVSGVISSQVATNLGPNAISFSVREGKKYTGYKQIDYIAATPSSNVSTSIVFNTVAQFDKINSSANVGIVSLSKLDFPTTARNGLDSYSFDTGLIGQANRVIYGDPRDPITYAGVNAAGTNIFVREPLLKRIQIALSIRTNIGVSFAQITQQIQSSVYALVQSNPLGQSLDLSSIVETVREIPGVTSVVLTNPAYNVSSDEIVLTTGEKAFIASQTNDINVSLIGS